MRKHKIDPAPIDADAHDATISATLSSATVRALDAKMQNVSKDFAGLQELARGSPKDSNKTWASELTNPHAWDHFLEDCADTILKINKDELFLYLNKVGDSYVRMAAMCSNFRVSYDLSAMKAALKDGRVTHAAYSLLFAYKHNDDGAELRTLTRNITEQLGRHGITGADFPQGLQLRMKAAVKMRAR